MSQNVFLNKNVLRQRWKVDRDVSEVTSSGSWCHVWGTETENARLPIVGSLTAGTVRRFVTAERKARRPGRSATQTVVPDITVPYHLWLCRSTEWSCTLRALVSAASGDTPVHLWWGQKTSAGRWALQPHLVLTAVGVWDRLVCRLACCCRNQAVWCSIRAVKLTLKRTEQT